MNFKIFFANKEFSEKARNVVYVVSNGCHFIQNILYATRPSPRVRSGLDPRVRLGVPRRPLKSSPNAYERDQRMTRNISREGNLKSGTCCFECTGANGTHVVRLDNVLHRNLFFQTRGVQNSFTIPCKLLTSRCGKEDITNKQTNKQQTQ